MMEITGFSTTDVSAESSSKLDGTNGVMIEFNDESDKEEIEEDAHQVDASTTVGRCMHSAIIRIDLGSAEVAQMICRTLAVDREPMRSTANRILSTEDNILVVNISSADRKYLQKSIDNLFDMCELAKQTYDVISAYELTTEKEGIVKKKKRMKRKMFKGLKSKLEDEAKRLQATVSQYSENIAQQVRSGAAGSHAVEDNFKCSGGTSASTSLRSSDSMTFSNLSDGFVTMTAYSSDTGSDISGHTRRFFGGGKIDESLSPVADGNAKLVDVDEPFEDSDMPGRSLSGSALMQEVPETDIFDESRLRRNSGGSVGSNESSLSTLFSSIPGMVSSSHRLETISSDVESESTAGSAFIGNASKEQISSVLHKLQGRAANYKDKYRELVKMYNEVVRENDKCRTVLAATQDKALQRIEKLRNEKRTLAEKLAENDERYRKDIEEREARIKKLSANRDDSQSSEVNAAKVKKLQELLEKCKMSIKENKEKIHQLTDENENLKKRIEGESDEQGISDLAVQRVTSEWKGRVDHLEAEWTKRLQDSEEKATLAIAKVKAEMHAALEERDSEVQNMRTKYKQLESQGFDAQGQIEELKSTIEALESEKADMVLKLSEAKQQGVKAVREEEEKKRQELMEELEKKRNEDRLEDERRLQEEIKKVEQKWQARFKEQEEQSQLAIEEREMQKVAAVMEHDRRNDNLGAMVEQLTAEKLQLVTSIEEMKTRHKHETGEMTTCMEAKDMRHKEEIAALIAEHEQIINELKRDFEEASMGRGQLKEQLDAAIKMNAKKVAELEARLKDTISEASSERKASQKIITQQAEELKTLRAECNKTKKLQEGLTAKLKEKECVLTELMKEQAMDGDEIATLRQQLEDVQTSAANERERLESEVNELKVIVEEKSAMIRNFEAEKENLTVELAASQELSKMHEHLQEQLKLARDERDEAEKRYLEMERRAEKAAADLEEDRRLLAEARAELEKSRVEVHTKLAEVAQDEVSKEELDRMRASVEQIRDEAQCAKKRLEQRAAALIAELEDVRNENSQLSTRLRKSEEHIRSLNATKRSSVEEMVTIKEKLSTMTADLISKREEIATTKESLKKHQEEVKLIHSQKAELERELELKNENIASLNLDLDSTRSIVEKLKEDVKLREQQQNTFEEEMRLKSDEIGKLNSLLKEKSTDYDALSSAKNDIEKALEHERTKVMQLQEQLWAVTNADNNELISIQQEIAIKDAKLNELIDKLNNAEQQMAALQGNLKLTEEQLGESESQKISLADELEEVRADRDGLIERIEETEQERNEERQSFEQQLQTLREKVKQKEDELIASKSSSEKLENEASTKLIEQTQQIAHLDALNQKLREEFLQKEGVVGELQKKIEQLIGVEKEQLAEIGVLKANLSQIQSQLESVERQLKNVREDADRTRDEAARAKSEREELDVRLQESHAEQERLKRRLAELEDEYEGKQEEGDKIRDQYALALKNSNDHLEEAQKQLAELDLIRIEKDRLATELSIAKEESENAVNEIKRKAEVKVGKIKKQCEADVQAAKAELLLQLNDMRSQIADRDLQIDEFKLTVAELQQKLIDEGQNEKIINDLRLNIEAIAAERDCNAKELEKLKSEMDDVKNAIGEARKRCETEINENTLLKKTIEELKSQTEQLNARSTQSEELEMKNRELMEQNSIYDSKLKELEAKSAESERNASEQLQKAIAKADADRQRMLRDLQKEIKQLYHDLNERSEQLSEANAKIESLMSESVKEEEAVQRRMSASYTEPNKKRTMSIDYEADQMDVEELHELRERVLQYKKEVSEMKEAHRLELAAAKKEALQAIRNSEIPNNNIANGTVTIDISDSRNYTSKNVDMQNSYDLSPNFAEPTEAEYLRNVLYRYMSERETLGRESVTLARVIGTVAKFSREQLDAVVAKEEERSHSWYGGTMSTVQGLVGSAFASGR